MFISTNKGDFKYDSVRKVLLHINKYRSDADEFWISIDEPYPCMAVCVSGSFAAITWFESENGKMKLSYNKNNKSSIAFTAGGEEWIPTPDAVISLKDAVSCITEFLTTHSLPLCIEWQEL